MKILDLFGKKDASAEIGKTLPYRIVAEFTPYQALCQQEELGPSDDEAQESDH